MLDELSESSFEEFELVDDIAVNPTAPKSRYVLSLEKVHNFFLANSPF